MATYSTNVSASWGGTPFAEVYDLSFAYGGGLPKGWDSEWSDDLGSVTLSCFGVANITLAEYGKRRQLVIGGGGASLTCMAVLESLAVQYGLNDVTRFTVTFKILDQ